MKEVQPIRDSVKLNEVRSILRSHNERDFMLFEMGINTGLRITDLLSLRVGDVRDRDFYILREQKTKKTKEIYIGHLQEDIAAYTEGMDDDVPLFPSRKGDAAISRQQAHKILAAAGHKAELEDIGCHSLRKTYGYHFYQKTKDVALLQDLFNHAAPSVTLRYIGINTDVRRKAMMDFGRI